MSEYSKIVNKYLSMIAKGELEAFEDLINFTETHLRGIANKYVFDKNNIDDVLLDSYEQVFLFIKTFDNQKNGYNWMCTIVRHMAFAYNKNHSNEVVCDKLVDKAENENEFDEILNKSIVSQIMDSLSLEDKNLIYLRIWEGLSFRDIAKKLGLKKSYVHLRISQILSNLKYSVDD